MHGKRSKRKPEGENKRDKLQELLMKMESALQAEKFEILPDLLAEFDRELDLALKGSFLPAETLKRYQKVLKHLEEVALKKKEELQKQESQFKKLKKYGEFG